MMKRRERRAAPEGKYEDPLKNYNAPDVEDELERSLLEGTVGDIKHQPFSAVRPSTTVKQVMQQMDELGVACILITDEGGRLAGIFSERDVLNRVMDRYEQVKDQPVAECMTVNPSAVYRTDSPAKAMNLMAVNGFRHVPILDVDDKVVGILGPRRLTTYLHSYFE